MRIWIYAGLTVAMYLVQSSLLGPLTLWGVRPDLVLITLSIFALHAGWWEGTVMGFAAGLFVDLAEGRLIGLGAITKACAGGAVGRLGQSVFGGNAIVPVIVVFVASLGEHLLYLLGTWAFGVGLPWRVGFVRVVMPSAWYDGLATAALFPLLALVVRWAESLRGERSGVSAEGS